MVAIKAAHIPLSDRDLWPGLPWTWEDTLRIKDECRQRAIDSGITDPVRLVFAEGREWEKYMNSFPKYGERQRIMKIVKPMKKAPGLFSEEELDYLLSRLQIPNDEVGQAIVEKLRKMKE